MGEAKIRQIAKAPVLGDRPKFKDALGNTIEQGDFVCWLVNGVKYAAHIEELIQPLVLMDKSIEPGKIAMRIEFDNVNPPVDKHGKAIDVQVNDMIVTRAPEKPAPTIIE